MSNNINPRIAFLSATFIIVFGLYSYLNFVAMHTVMADLDVGLVLLAAASLSGVIFVLTCRTSYAKLMLLDKLQGRESEAASRLGLLRVKYGFWFILLFCVSGYGIFSGMMLLFEGPRIVADVARDALQRSIVLDDQAQVALPSPDYRELEQWTYAQLGALKNEMTIGDGRERCGLGSYAQQILADIGRRIESVHSRNGVVGTPACSDKRKNNDDYKQYEAAALEGLSKTAIAVNSHFAERAVLAGTIHQHRQKIEGTLGFLLSDTAGLGNYLLDFQKYPQAVRIFRDVANGYFSDRQALVAFLPELKRKLPEAIDISIAENLSSPFYVVNAWRTRWDHLTTWLFTLMPAGIDFGLSLWGAYALRRHRLWYAEYELKRSYTVMGKTKVRHLWNPVSQTKV